MDGKECSFEKKEWTKCLVPVAVVFAVMFAFDWVFHGMIMMPQYRETAALWRPEAEMGNYWWVCIITKIVMASVITCLFCCVSRGTEHCGKCTNSGAKFGFKIGLLLGIFQWSSYSWLPIPMQMAVFWLVGYVALGVIIGVVLAYLARRCKGEENKSA